MAVHFYSPFSYILCSAKNYKIASALTCGAKLVRTPHYREKKFCSDACRMAWWNSHPEAVSRKAIYHFTCARCGRPFDSYGNDHRKYCSRACYAEARRKGV